jgi:hypothetical protein
MLGVESHPLDAENRDSQRQQQKRNRDSWLALGKDREGP